jgi:hypothetical protein
MIDEIMPVLQRNQGNILTPELINGIAASIEVALNRPIRSSLLCVPPPEIPINTHQRIVTQNEMDIAGWVSCQLGFLGSFGGPIKALGWTDLDGNLCAGVVMEQFSGTNAYIHVAASGKRWLQRPFLHALFGYLFVTCGLKRITGLVEKKNEAALKFDLHVGFEQECVIKDGVDGDDIIVLVMWRNKCRWIKE